MAASAALPRTAILIGQPQGCRRLEAQLNLLEVRPMTIGWVVLSDVTRNSLGCDPSTDGPVLGTIDELEAVLARRRPAVALISLPSTMGDAIAQIRTRLRRIGVPDRFMPTLEDQIAGIGPRSHVDIDLAALIDRPPRVIDTQAVRKLIAGRNVLITGAGGSIGSELCRLVARFEPSQLQLIDRSENALFEIDRQIARRFPRLSRRAILHDVVDARGTKARFRELTPEIVFHAAAHKHVPLMEDHPAAAIDNNLFGTVSVADAAHECGSERFVMISTDKAVNPTSVMGATKRLAELYVQAINQRSTTGFAIVRFGNVLGSSGSVLDTWARQIADGGPLTVTDPRMTRYFMTIPEAAALVTQAASLVDPCSKDGEVFLLNMGEPFRIVDLAQRFVQQFGLIPVVDGEEPPDSGHRGTISIVFTGARPGEKLFEELVFNAQQMRRTSHSDVHIWGLPEPDPQYVEQLLVRLSASHRSQDPAKLASEIHAMIPEVNCLAAA